MFDEAKIRHDTNSESSERDDSQPDYRPTAPEISDPKAEQPIYESATDITPESNYLEYTGKKQTKGHKRRSVDELKAEHELFVKLYQARHPKLYIMAKLGIDSLTYNSMLGRALEEKGIASVKPSYEVEWARNLSPRVRSLLKVNCNVLFKIGITEKGIMLTPILLKEITD